MTKRTQPKPAPAARATISPLEVPDGVADMLDVGRALLLVLDYNGADAYHVKESTRRDPDNLSVAYRTVQRLELATRLRLAADYDAADLVDRTFQVEA